MEASALLAACCSLSRVAVAVALAAASASASASKAAADPAQNCWPAELGCAVQCALCTVHCGDCVHCRLSALCSVQCAPLAAQTSVQATELWPPSAEQSRRGLCSAALCVRGRPLALARLLPGSPAQRLSARPSAHWPHSGPQQDASRRPPDRQTDARADGRPAGRLALRHSSGKSRLSGALSGRPVDSGRWTRDEIRETRAARLRAPAGR